MKAILTRLFAHEELSHEEARTLMQGITQGKYNDTQVASLLTVFQMRGIKVDELAGFRQALLETEATGKTPSTSPPVPALWWLERAMP